MIENILLVLFIVLFGAKLFGSFFERFGLDSSLGELLIGIILGVSVLNLINPKSIEDFAIIGSVLILFVAGLNQPSLKEMYRDTRAVKLGLVLLGLTTLAMTIFFYFGGKFFGVQFNLLQSIVFAIAFGIIDIGVPAKIMISKGYITTPFGRVVVNSAIINIISGLALFTVSTLFFSNGIMDLLIKVGEMLAVVGIVLLLAHTFDKISKFVMRLRTDEAEFSLAIIIVLLLAYLTDLIGFTCVLGAFIAGTLVARTPFANTKSFSDRMKVLSMGLFIPLFFAWFGLGINIAEIFKYAALAVTVFFAYTALRFTITYVFAKHYRFRVPLLISTSMLSVDVESVIVLLIALKLGIFKDSLPLTIFAPSVFLSTLLIVILVAILSRKEKIGGTKSQNKEIKDSRLAKGSKVSR